MLEEKARSKSEWPTDFFEFQSLEDIPVFKESRNELGEISEDPLS